jgi:hypothetical protein
MYAYKGQMPVLSWRRTAGDQPYERTLRDWLEVVFSGDEMAAASSVSGRSVWSGRAGVARVIVKRRAAVRSWRAMTLSVISLC